jgi:CSLREA domain-containing protein
VKSLPALRPLVIAAIVSFGAPLAHGQIAVTTVADHDDGTCDSSDCTLREAITRANAVSGNDTISFRSDVIGTIALQSALPDITTNVTIKGPGARTLAVSGNNTVRVFSVSATSTSTISGLTIRDGSVVPDLGAGLGGGMFNQGNLTVSDCTFSANHAQGTDEVVGSGDDGDGSALYNNGVLTVSRCTFTGNSTVGGHGAPSGFRRGAGGGGGGNGAIFNDFAGTLSLNNCTVAGNSASGGTGGSGGSTAGGNGGAARPGIVSAGTMTVTACTLSGNTGTGGAGGSGTPAGTAGSVSGGLFQSSSGGSTTVRNTISAGNANSDAEGTFTSSGYNLIGVADFSSGFNGTADQKGTTAKLGPLQNNGGATDTMALLTGSPAIDKGKSFGLTTDERGVGYKRTVDKSIANATNGDGTDIGALESGAQLKAVSRKKHGTLGNFDISLPLNGTTPGVECRTGGTSKNYKLIVTFPSAITVAGADVTLDPNAANPTGHVSSFSVNGAKATVNLTTVSNAQRLLVNLRGVSDGTTANDVTVPISVLLGNVTGDGAVSSDDVSLTQSRVGQAVSKTTSREDVNLDGAINSMDVNIVQSNVGTRLQWETGDLVTHSQESWDGTTSWYNDYNSVYGASFGLVEVGIPGSGGYSMQFGGNSNVSAYFIAAGTPAALNADLVNPTSSSSGQFGGEVLALRLNVDFNVAGKLGGASELKFGSLTVCGMSDATLNGKTVNDVLAIVNTLLGGGSNGYTIADINAILAQLNAAFTDGTPTQWAQQHLFVGSCPPPCTPGAPGCGWRQGDESSYNQFNWDSSIAGAPLLKANFASVYAPDAGLLSVGIVGSTTFSMSFSSADAVLNYLPTTGPNGPLTSDLLNPTTSPCGEFGGDVVALKLNVDFSDDNLLARSSSTAFGDLLICGASPLPDGTTVRQLLSIANTVLAGQPSSYTIAQIAPIVNAVNAAFVAGAPSTFAQQHLFVGSCPP